MFNGGGGKASQISWHF